MASLPPDKHQDQSEDGRGDPSASGFREQRGHQAQAQGNGGDGFFFVRFLKETHHGKKPKQEGDITKNDYSR